MTCGRAHTTNTALPTACLREPSLTGHTEMLSDMHGYTRPPARDPLRSPDRMNNAKVAEVERLSRHGILLSEDLRNADALLRVVRTTAAMMLRRGMRVTRVLGVEVPWPDSLGRLQCESPILVADREFHSGDSWSDFLRALNVDEPVEVGRSLIGPDVLGEDAPYPVLLRNALAVIGRILQDRGAQSLQRYLFSLARAKAEGSVARQQLRSAFRVLDRTRPFVGDEADRIRLERSVEGGIEIPFGTLEKTQEIHDAAVAAIREIMTAVHRVSQLGFVVEAVAPQAVGHRYCWVSATPRELISVPPWQLGTGSREPGFKCACALIHPSERLVYEAYTILLSMAESCGFEKLIVVAGQMSQTGSRFRPGHQFFTMHQLTADIMCHCSQPRQILFFDTLDHPLADDLPRGAKSLVLPEIERDDPALRVYGVDAGTLMWIERNHGEVMIRRVIPKVLSTIAGLRGGSLEKFLRHQIKFAAKNVFPFALPELCARATLMQTLESTGALDALPPSDRPVFHNARDEFWLLRSLPEDWDEVWDEAQEFLATRSSAARSRSRAASSVAASSVASDTTSVTVE
jgi:hypothetical protein